jgi:hypothetical protein
MIDYGPSERKKGSDSFGNSFISHHPVSLPLQASSKSSATPKATFMPGDLQGISALLFPCSIRLCACSTITFASQT